MKTKQTPRHWSSVSSFIFSLPSWISSFLRPPWYVFLFPFRYTTGCFTAWSPVLTWAGARQGKRQGELGEGGCNLVGNSRFPIPFPLHCSFGMWGVRTLPSWFLPGRVIMCLRAWTPSQNAWVWILAQSLFLKFDPSVASTFPSIKWE